jgi:hypothetical protein
MITARPPSVESAKPARESAAIATWYFRDVGPRRTLAARDGDVPGCVAPSRLSEPPGAFKGAMAIDCATAVVGDLSRNLTVKRRGKVFVVVHHGEHRVVITGVQEFYGSGATESYAARATEIINRVWTGKTTLDGEPYEIECAMTGRRVDATLTTLSTAIEVVDTAASLAHTAEHDPSHQALYGRGPGYQHSTDLHPGAVVPAHEFGHAVGLDDEYVETKGHLGKKRHTRRTGPAGGIMGESQAAARPTAENFASVITGRGLLPVPGGSSCATTHSRRPQTAFAPSTVAR